MITPSRVASLCRSLRAAGLPCALHESTTGLEALPFLDTDDPEEVRLGLRGAFCASHDELTIFDSCFWSWWTTMHKNTEPPSLMPDVLEWPDSGTIHSSLLSDTRAWDAETKLDETESDRENELSGTGYSPVDKLAQRSFTTLAEEDLHEIDAWIDRLMFTLSARRSRRLERGGIRGPIDIRHTLKNSTRYDGELLRLERRRRRMDPPDIVTLCDVSGSMERYSRFLLRFLLGCGRTREIQTFAFSTRLTHLTPWLVNTDVDLALAELRTRGWSSGTRIGDCLTTFVQQYGTRMLRKRTVVIILSDGLDQGEMEPLETAMRAIKRRTRRVIWLNPLLESSRYAPEARGMRTALPFIDNFQPGHSLQALEELPRLLRV